MKELKERFEKYQVYWYGLYKKLSKEEEEYILKLYPDFNLEVGTYLYFYKDVKGEKDLQTRCKVCNNLLSFTNIKNRNKCCSAKCSSNDPDKLDRTKETWIKKYGVDNPSKSQEIQNKKEETTLKNYGVKCSFQSPELREKMKQAQIEKYGYVHNFSAKPVMEKHIQYMKENYGVLHNSQMHLKDSNVLYDKINDLIENNIHEMEFEVYSELLKISGLTDTSGRRALKKNNIKLNDYGKSLPEQDLIDFIETLKVPYLAHVKGMLENKQYELDIVFPKYNIAIELDGVYYHSSKNIEEDNYMSKRHLNKTEQCEDKGIQLLHIFENEWEDLTKKEIWKSVIRNKLGLTETKIYARKCVLSEISNKQAKEFCDLNHLQGGIYGSLNLGLFYKGELVQVAILAKPRFNKNYRYELLRLCSKLNTVVVGGASKLLKDLSNVVSYANRRWSIGKVYQSSGFNYVKKTNPCYWYWHSIRNDSKLQHRSTFQKHRLPYLLDTFDPNLTEQENMYNNKYKRIWDCGNLVYAKQ